MFIMEILNSLEDIKKLNRYRCGMDFFFFNEVVSHYVALTNLHHHQQQWHKRI